MIEICECCGQTLLPKVKLTVHLSVHKRHLFDLIYKAGKAGIDRPTLFNTLYKDRIDGGPDSSNIIVSLISQLNTRIKTDGYMIVNLHHKGRGNISRYAIQRCSKETVA